VEAGAGKDPALLAEVLKRALSAGGEYGDLFVEERLSLRLRMEEGRIEPPLWGHDAGAGIRLINTGITQYVYTDDLGEQGLRGAVDAMLRRSVPPTQADYIPPSKREPTELPWMDSLAAMEWMRAADRAARRADPAVFQVEITYLPFRQKVQVLTSQRPYVGETRTNYTFRVNVYVRKGDRTAEGSAGCGGWIDKVALDETVAASLGEEAAEVAVRMLDAGPAPAGDQTVVITNGWGGVLFHEACGHGLEADFVQRGSSYLAGRKGRRVASEKVTVVDDPTIDGGRGSYGVDDEGVPGERKLLIEKGVLNTYMYDVRTALKEGIPSTGNGRRQSYRDLPLPRMSNICMLPGPYDHREILENTRSGIFVASMGGGTVDLGSGDFVFSVTEGYRIEKGKLGRPIRGATLVGQADGLLKDIDMIGDDLRFDPGYGSCGKEGQILPAGVGQPTIRIPSLLVGGTEF
jgi:TldD protein